MPVSCAASAAFTLTSAGRAAMPSSRLSNAQRATLISGT